MGISESAGANAKEESGKITFDFRFIFVCSEGSSDGSGAGQTAANNKSSLSVGRGVSPPRFARVMAGFIPGLN